MKPTFAGSPLQVWSHENQRAHRSFSSRRFANPLNRCSNYRRLNRRPRRAASCRNRSRRCNWFGRTSVWIRRALGAVRDSRNYRRPRGCKRLRRNREVDMTAQSMRCAEPGTASLQRRANVRLQRHCACSPHTSSGGVCQCDEKGPKESAAVGRGGTLSHVDEVIRSPGAALDYDTRRSMESRFSHDFSNVRVHIGDRSDESTRALSAIAYTVGRDIVFARGQYAPNSETGNTILVHELAHVMQSASHEDARGSLELGPPDSPQEREAEEAAAFLAADGNRRATSSAASSGLIQRQLPLPGPPPTVGRMGLSIDERGRVSVIAAGPEATPVVPSPTLGIRHDPDGKWHILVGSRDKVVADEDIPKMLRDALGAAGAPAASRNLKVPKCEQLQFTGKEQLPRFMTFEQYKSQQKLWHSQVQPLGGEQWVDMTPALYDALISSCVQQAAPLPKPPPLQDLPPSTLPPGEAYA